MDKDIKEIVLMLVGEPKKKVFLYRGRKWTRAQMEEISKRLEQVNNETTNSKH